MQRYALSAVSGKWSAALLVLCFAVAGILLPVAAHLPRWVEFELVLGAWWVIWVIGIAALLYRGGHVSDDAPGIARPRLKLNGFGDAITWNGCSGTVVDGLVGCDGIVFALMAIMLLVAGIWLAIEVLIPGLAFLVYFLVRGLTARAVNGGTACQGMLIRSIVWGILWATIYTAPLALAVLGAHAAHPRLHRLT